MHIGARNASPVLYEYQLKFFEDVLLPYIEKEDVRTILQLGDMFDSRKFSNHGVLFEWRERFFDVLHARGIKVITLLGNHDIASRNSLKVNSTSLFLNHYDNIDIVSSPREQEIEGVPFVIVPWICDENKDEVDALIQNTTSVYCAGHFEFAGFDMQKGVAANGGDDPSFYEKFDTVFSGHFHTRSSKKNIVYTGVPYEMTWADYNDPKGFHVFDTSRHTFSFVQNPLTLFNRVEYNDKDVEPTDVVDVKDTYVKVVVVNKTDPYRFEKFINSIVLQNPADLKITDIAFDFDDVDIEEEDLGLEDTKTLIEKFIDQSDTELDKDRLKDMMKSLYLSALEVTE